jgi:hypothetical protein
MEVKLKVGDSLNIPEGCKAVIKNNVVVFEKEEKEEEREFQDGDVLRSICDHEVLIFKKSTDSEYFSSYYNYSGKDNNMWLIDAFRHATDEEKQLLFDKMKEQRLLWNAKEKRVETIRWRAKGKEIYYYVGCNMEVYTFSPSTSEDEEDDFNSYNYFRIKEQAEEAARRMKEVLFQYHEEIGE